MIGKLKGIVDFRTNDYAIIDVNNVGYLVYCSNNTLNTLIIKESCDLFIETHVRDDHIHLYGFKSYEEKKIFNTLQSVNGVGAKMSLHILSSLSPFEIQAAIQQKNLEVFQKISGIGKKIAERIMIELKDKNFTSVEIDHNNKLINDAILGLLALGITKSKACFIVHEIINKKSNITLDEIIKEGLKMHGNHESS